MSNKIVRADDLAGLFAEYGVGDTEDQAAIREAIAQGSSFEDAASELGYSSKSALAKPAKKGKAIASPTVAHPDQAFVDTGAVVETIKEDAYRTGYQVIEGARVVRRQQFAKGVEAALVEGAEEDNQFFRETANAGIAALRFRPSH